MFRRERKEEIKRNLPQIIEGKKAKRRKILEERQKRGEIVDKEELEQEIEFDVESVLIAPIKPEQALVEVHLGRKNEPRHDKTNRMSVRPAKTQISLGICPV